LPVVYSSVYLFSGLITAKKFNKITAAIQGKQKGPCQTLNCRVALFQPSYYMYTFPWNDAAIAGKVFFFGAGGADLPMFAIDRCQQRGVALETPEITAGKTEPYGGIVEVFDMPAINSVVTAAMRALSDDCGPLLSIPSLLMYLKGSFEGLLNTRRQKLPHF
jgi:hypothetical protein